MNMYLIYLPIVALVIGYTMFMRRRAASALSGSRPAAIDYFRRTGYCYADRLGMPPEVQADRSLQDANELNAAAAKQASKQDYEHTTHQVRDYHGIQIHFRTSFGAKFTPLRVTSFRSASWAADVPKAPRVPLHVADKSLVSVTKAVGEMLTNTTREFHPAAPNRIETGIATIDDKLVVFGEDPQATRALFQNNPALVDLLTGWAALDVCVTAKGAVFNDPSQDNMQAAMGGTIGGMALGFDMAKRLELMIPVHDRVSDLLVALVQATA